MNVPICTLLYLINALDQDNVSIQNLATANLLTLKKNIELLEKYGEELDAPGAKAEKLQEYKTSIEKILHHFISTE